LFDLSNNEINVDYSKTYYYQKEQSAKIMEKNNKISAPGRSWISQLFKISFALGLSCLVLSNKKIIDYSFNKLFKI